MNTNPVVGVESLQSQVHGLLQLLILHTSVLRRLYLGLLVERHTEYS